MVASIKLNLDTLNDYIEGKCGGKEYFFGCWSADDFEVDLKGEYPNIQSNRGDNWIVLRNGADRVNGLVFPKENSSEPEVTIFKGYLAEEALHSYSDASKIKKYWSEKSDYKHNGVFAAVTITENGRNLNMITDIFGLVPLFVRTVGKFVYFSNVAGLLCMDNDQPNSMSGIMRLLLGYVPEKETLVKGVEKVSPAAITSFSESGVRETLWYDYHDFPKGDEPYDQYAVDQSHEGFISAIQRCANIKHGENLLTLTSGYDSRRIFAHLLDSNVPFKACTVQMPSTGGADVDAIFGKQMADDHNVDHTALKMDDPNEWFNSNLRKIFTFDGLCDYHTWSMSFFNRYQNENLCIYDGLFGDNFIVPDWEFTETTLGSKPKDEPWFIKRNFCPSLKSIVGNFDKLWHYDSLGNINAIINYVLWQTRNSTSYWSQMQTRPGQLTICPYVDLKYVELMLRFKMEEDVRDVLPQKDVLDKYWPELAKYPGSRDIPDDSKNLKNQREEMDAHARRELMEACKNSGADQKLFQLLSFRGKIVLWLSKIIPSLVNKLSWWTDPLPEMSLWWINRPRIIEVKEDKEPRISIDPVAINAYVEDLCGGKEYFLGLWSPENININLNDIPKNIQLEQGNNWAVLRNGSDICDGLLFPKIQRGEAGPEMVVFRGYLAEAQIHSYSAKKEVRDYWSEDLMRRHNGVFNAVTISADGSKLSFVSDIFGIGPIYFRKIGDVVLFSSCSATLAMQDDQADLCSWMLNLSIGFIPENDTMTKEIKQPDPASVTSFTREGMKTEMWHDPSSFPMGDGVVDDDIYALSHKQFEKAVQRCMNLSHGKQLLPLSSGHDSRRIFGHMIDSEQPFESCTVQMTTATGEDLDLHIGEKMAADHGIDHVAIKVPQKTQWRKNDVKRILSMDGQTQAHTWSVPLFAHYQDQKITIFDGLGGDVFGFHGLIVNEVKNIETPVAIPNIFKSGLAPSQTHTTEIIDKMKSRHEYGPNHGLLTFLNSVSRKSTSLWAQQQISPGQLVVYPYLDIDYVEMMFSYSYKEKNYKRAQFIIMEKYWPKLAAYPSSREIPEGTCNIRELYKTNINYSFSRLIKDSYERGASSFHYDSLLTVPSRIVLYLNRFSDTLRQHSDWWTHPIIEYMYWWQRRPFVVTFDDEDED